MADEQTTHDEAALAVVARHAIHDEELIAAFADGGLEPEEAIRARALVERCVACRDLHRDLAGITAAIRASGTAAQVAAVRSAPRDFRLTPAMVGQAGPARPRGFLDRLAAAVRAFGRPMGASLATLGIVGLLVGSVGLGAPAGGAPGFGSASTRAPGLEVDPGAVTGPDGSDRTAAFASATPTGKNDAGAPPARDTALGGPGAWLVVASGLSILLGIVLIVASTRRRGARDSSA